MKIAETMDRAAYVIRAVKERRVRRAKAGVTDVPTFIEFFRGHEELAIVENRPERDEMLDLIHMGLTGFAADAVCWSMDTWQSAYVHDNPLTGQPWQQGDMADLVQHHDGLARGWVVECLMTVVANRAGDLTARFQPYRVEGRAVTWLDLADLTARTGQDSEEVRKWLEEGALGSGGAVLDAVRKMVNAPTMLDRITRDYPEVGNWVPKDYERKQFHIDVGTVNAMLERYPQANVAMVAKPGSPRHQLLRERFPSRMIIDPRNLGL